VTSVLTAVSSVDQLEENVQALDHTEFTDDELRRIDEIVGGAADAEPR
jgi:aryl-alcohol dehydrogenase-like predicted oxidoreductase